MFNIKEELKMLPEKPGVYIMRDKNNNILYVGKAVILKNRVRQYFQKTNKTTRIEKMVSQIEYFEYIVTDNEVEALILECNLIKENRPKYNVLLKDDKMYPYIKIDIKEEYPTVYMTRKIFNDGAKYFGPYSDGYKIKETLDFIKKNFKIRQCKKYKNNKRECLNYHINRCSGPCLKNISKEDYNKIINQIIMFLEGKTTEVIKELEKQIRDASQKLDFEEAAKLRDKMLAIQRLSEKQKVSNISENNIDVIGIARNEPMVCVEIFFVRGSKLIAREDFFIKDAKELLDKEVASTFIKQYYINKEHLPSKIMLKDELEDIEIIGKWLSEKSRRKVELKTPKKGEKLKFVEMAEINAKLALDKEIRQQEDILLELKEILKLDKLPVKIESYDISNISGKNIVAGMIVVSEGKIKRNLSRRFKIKTIFNQDDPGCVEEVITRRLKHSIDRNEKDDRAFGNLPDCIFVDGGITQIRAAKRAMKKYQVDIPVFGMVKDDKHRTKSLIDENRKEIHITDKIKNFVTLIQDEVHRTAIEYHKKLREKEITKSELDFVNGIGENKKQTLLKHFGSIEKIRQASISDLVKVKGINQELAEKIKIVIN